MEEKINEILSVLQKTNGRLENIENGQMALTKGQKELSSKMESVEKGQIELSCRMEEGHNEIKEMIKHNTTLMTENFTYIRKDMRALERCKCRH
jgi:hypothetical protein